MKINKIQVLSMGKLINDVLLGISLDNVYLAINFGETPFIR